MELDALTLIAENTGILVAVVAAWFALSVLRINRIFQ
jgi:hypothetical protein